MGARRADVKIKIFKSAAEFRTWLEKNHDRVNGTVARFLQPTFWQEKHYLS